MPRRARTSAPFTARTSAPAPSPLGGALISLPPSRALRWLREAGPRRRDTADAAFGPAPAAFQACGRPKVLHLLYLQHGRAWWHYVVTVLHRPGRAPRARPAGGDALHPAGLHQVGVLRLRATRQAGIPGDRVAGL